MINSNKCRLNIIREGFKIGIGIKAITGIIEAVLGIFVLYFPSLVIRGVQYIFMGEISEDPKDRIVNLIIEWSNTGLGGLHNLIGLYLLVIGLAKLGFIVALLKKRLNAYLVYETILVIFVIYQVRRFVLLGEISVLILTLVDLFVIVFIHLEYMRLKRRI